MSRRRCTPRSRSKIVVGSSSLVEAETRICPPCAAFISRETRLTVAPSTRALVDPNNAAGDPFPASYDSAVNGGCCDAAAPRTVCNAPMAANNGVGGLNSADALCKAMGFTSGTVVAEVSTSNSCPKPHSLTANGSSWTSNWSNVLGYGRQDRCTR